MLLFHLTAQTSNVNNTYMPDFEKSVFEAANTHLLLVGR